jgi:hypothetical protein
VTLVKDFESSVSTVLDSIGIEPDPQSLEIRYYGNLSSAFLQDTSGLLNISIESVYSASRGNVRSLSPYAGAEDYMLNGLLRSEQGCFDFVQAEDSQLGESQAVGVTLLSSPEGVTAAYRATMQRPGEDIFKPVTTDRKNDRDPLVVIEAASRKEILIANLGDWKQREKDLQLSEGPQAWFAMPSAITNRIASRADEIVKGYGSAKYYDADYRKKAAYDFVSDLSEAAVFSRALYARVFALNDPERLEQNQTPRDVINRSLDINRTKYTHQEYKMRYPYERYARIFTSLGIISIEIDKEDSVSQIDALKSITAMYMKHLADSFIKLETVQPSSELADHSQQKIALLEHVIEWVDMEVPSPARHALNV